MLIRAGYEVDTVFGADGVMACEPVGGYPFVLINEAWLSKDRKTLIGWFTANSPELTILFAA